MERESYLTPVHIALIVLATILAALLVWQVNENMTADPAVVWAAPVEPLQPTPAIELRPGWQASRAEPQIVNEGGDVTIVNNTTITSVDTDICVALICPPAQP